MKWLWPDETQSFLLKAALLDGDLALDAFHAWKARADFSANLDPASFRLLPLLYANMKRLGCTDPLMMRLGGTHRYFWVQIQEIRRDAALLLTRFAQANIPTMVTKGLALGTSFYDNIAFRPMSDIDIIIAEPRLDEAIRMLEAADWRPYYSGYRTIAWKDLVLYRHSVGFRNSARKEMDLHWSASQEIQSRATSELLWQDAVPIEIAGAATMRPSASHLFLLTAVHGLRWNAMPPLRWIADCLTILRKEGDGMDWEGMVALARREGVASRLNMALRFLRDEMAADISQFAIDRSSETPPTLAERVVNWSALTDPGTSRTLRLLKGRRVTSLVRMIRLSNTHRIPGVVLRWIPREVRRERKRRHAH
ncbi:nucleotidyltransferase family protein [Flavisphingomonas formosensis]|uniref:nucleotidyltransferase family protein n=1 Tax=Flavisphingomonas formosensis TaxID=861534 RepID=UPI0012FA3C9B|nr:nucleotidyltransferase family protein [Sphingomonas formosensis]